MSFRLYHVENILNCVLRTYPLIHPLIYASRMPRVRLEFLSWIIAIVSIFPLCNNLSQNLLTTYETKQKQLLRINGCSARHKNKSLKIFQQQSRNNLV